MNNEKLRRHEGRKAITRAVFGAIGMVIGSLNAAVVNITEGSTTGYTIPSSVKRNRLSSAGGWSR